jgi:hypothetical protein
MEPFNRNRIIEEIYDKKKENYKDLRNFNTFKKIEKRINDVKLLISKIPKSKRTADNQKFKRLSIEKSLLIFKSAIYDKQKFSTQPIQVTLSRLELECLDNQWFYKEKETPDIKEERKKESTLILLKLIFLPKGNEQLQKILDLVNK